MELSSGVVSWKDVRAKFIEYLKSVQYDDRTARSMLSYLDRYVTVIREPYDIITLFSKVKRGKNHLVKSLRKLFKFYEILGFDDLKLEALRKALPKAVWGVDIRIPLEDKIREALQKIENEPFKYHVLYDVLLDSGLRVVEGVALVNGFKMENVQEVNGFYRYELAMFRGTKQAYYGHFSKHTLEELQQIREPIKERAASRILGKHDLIRPKYLRKYAFDKMIELDVPESVADFIEGRVPISVGAKHYMALARQSAKFYPRYLEHLEKLRRD